MIFEKRVLVVEDDPTVYPLIARMIYRMNPKVNVEFALSAEGAEDLMLGLRQKYDVIISDIGLAGEKTGVDLVNDTYFDILPTPFILTSANRDFKTRLPFLAKPFRYEELVAKLEPYVGEHALTLEERTGVSEIVAAKGEKPLEWGTFVSVAFILLTFYFLLHLQMEHLPLIPWSH